MLVIQRGMKAQGPLSTVMLFASWLSAALLGAQENAQAETWQWVEDFPNLVRNPGFTKLDKNGWAVAWNHGNWGSTKGEVTVVKNARSNGPALRMTHSPYRYVKQRVRVEPGARYFIAFRVRTEFVRIGDGGRGPGIHVYGKPGFYKLSYSRRLAGSNKWRYIVLAEEATFGKSTEAEVVLENHRGSGTVWIDDVRFVKRTIKWDVRRLQERLAKMLSERGHDSRGEFRVFRSTSS